MTWIDLNQDDLVKINVYYDSLNEKGIKEKVDYSLEVRLKLLWTKISETSEMKIS